jgi:phage/plasmid-associated DNA primase
MNVLTQVSNEKDEKNNYIKNTRGRRFFNSQEARDGAVFNGETLKSLAGGSDTITTRVIFEKPVSFVPSFTMHLCVNSVPLTTGFGDSIKRRCVVVPFPFQFKAENTYDPNDKFHRKQDITIKDKKFNQSTYRDEFMLLLIEAHKKGKVEMPEMINNITRDYTDANNPLADWLSSEYEKSNDLNDKSKWILANALMKEYKDFPNADDDMTIRKFVPLMTDVNNYTKTKMTNAFKVNGETKPKGVYIQGISKKVEVVEEQEAEVEVVRKHNTIFQDYD